jgi:putative transposase
VFYRENVTGPATFCNFATVSYGDGAALYPGGALKEDIYYFAKERAKCDDSASRKARRLDRKQTERRSHFLHTLSKHIVSEFKQRSVYRFSSYYVESIEGTTQ